MKKLLSLMLVLVFLTSCGSNASAGFNAAGCYEVDNLRLDLAAQQFSLAAQNGDPRAVKAADDSRKLWYLMTYSPANETFQELKARLADLKSVEKDVKSYCRNR